MKPWPILFLYISAARLCAADFVRVNSPNDFGPTTLITFAGLAPFMEPTNVAGVGFHMSNGQGPDVVYDPTPPREFGPAEGTAIQNLASGFLDMTMSFPNPIQEIGFEVRTFTNVNINLTFFSHGSTIQTLSFASRTLVSSDLELYFYGFESDTPFDQVLLGVQGPARYLDFFEMDNLQFGVPEPSSAAILTVGSVVLGRRLFRRKNRESRGQYSLPQGLEEGETNYSSLSCWQ